MWWLKSLAVGLGLWASGSTETVTDIVTDTLPPTELILEQQIRLENSVYCRSSFDIDRPFVQKEHLKKSEKKLWGTGAFDRPEKVIPVKDTKVIGVDYRGHSWVWLEQIEDAPMLKVDIQFDGEIQEVRLKYNSQFSVPVQFEEGNWENYQDGKPVKLKFDDLGLKMIAQEKSRVLKTLMDQTVITPERVQTSVEYYRFQGSGPSYGVFVNEQSECLELNLPPSEFRVRVTTD